MARKAKIPNEIKKRFTQESQKRKRDVRSKRKYYLKVHELVEELFRLIR